MRLLRSLLIGLAAVLPLYIGVCAGALAQSSSSGLSDDQIEEQARRALDRGRSDTRRATETEILTSDPVVRTPIDDERLAPIEEVFSKRAGRVLRLFGYDSFGVGTAATTRLSGALQENYLLGPGDEVVIDLRGQRNETTRARVDREGRVTLPGLAPISASGRRLGDFRADVEQRVKDAFIATEAFVSIGSVRQITVLVAGEVNSPGPVNLSALNSPIDALLVAGGVRKTGSLRNIRIQRGDEIVRIDLYSVLAGSNGPIDATLTDGDRIIVPPIGATIAASGDVNRPAIFELGPGQKAITIGKLLELAGGSVNPGPPRLSTLRVGADGREMLTASSLDGAPLGAGDILFVDPIADATRGRVVLEGQVRVPGAFDSGRRSSLKALLADPQVFGEEPYMLFAAISRRDPNTFFRTLIPFSPLQVVQGGFDLPLQEDDIVRVFSISEVRDLAAELAIEEANKDPTGQKRPRSSNGDQDTDRFEAGSQRDSQSRPSQSERERERDDRLSDVLPDQERRVLSRDRDLDRADEEEFDDEARRERPRSGDDEFLTPVMRRAEEAEKERLDQLERIDERKLAFNMDDPAIRSLIGNYRVSVLGSVQVPGEYLIAPGTTLQALVAAAGGLEVNTDLTAIEVTSTDIKNETGVAKTSRASFSVSADRLAQILLKPRDVVRFREIYSDRDGGQVRLLGQVRFPGTFDILRGERLSSVISRAGGLTEIAYPYGAIFTRESAARAEEDGYRRASAELERQFTVILAEQQVSAQAVDFIRQTIEELQDAQGLGRISVEADPVRLASNPDQDTILEPGDLLYVPRRPNSVSVTGEVLSAGSFLFKSGRGGRDYVRLAGGFGPAADKGRTFILMPDGTARSLSGSVFRFGGAEIVPGATIIVPRDLRPFRFRQFAIDVAQITSQLAVSAASIAVISNNN